MDRKELETHIKEAQTKKNAFNEGLLKELLDDLDKKEAQENLSKNT